MTTKISSNLFGCKYLALVPAFCTLITGLSGCSKMASVANPSLKVPSTINLGYVSDNTIVSGEINISNQGEGRLRIYDLTASCSCVVLAAGEVFVEPWSTKKLPFQITVSQRSGNFRKRISFRTNDPTQPAINLSLEGFVDALAFVEPDRIVLTPEDSRKHIIRTFAIKPQGKHQLTSTPIVKCKIPSVISKVVSYTSNGSTIELDLHDLPAGELLIDVDLEYIVDGHSIGDKISISGNVKGLSSASPAAVIFSGEKRKDAAEVVFSFPSPNKETAISAEVFGRDLKDVVSVKLNPDSTSLEVAVVKPPEKGSSLRGCAIIGSDKGNFVSIPIFINR